MHRFQPVGGNQTSGDNRDDRDHDLDHHDFDDSDDDCGLFSCPFHRNIYCGG